MPARSLALRLSARRALALAPALLALLLWAPPARAAVEIEEVTSPGGIEAWLVEERTLPFVAIEIRFEGGAALDPEGAEGATFLMAALLEEGAGERDATAFAAAREALAARLSFDAGHDTVSVSARMLTENRDEAADLLREALAEPRFEEDAIERVRAQILSRIRSDATDPNALASQAFAEMAFGDHPYARPLRGTEASVEALSRADLADAHARALVRSRAVVAAVGDIDAAALGDLLDRVLGDLPQEGPALPDPAEVALEGQVRVVPFDSPQSVIVFGHEGILREDPDYIPAYILVEMLGGRGFEGRLMQEIRVARGLTYGVYAFLVPRDLAGTVQGGLSTQNASAGEAVEVLREEWARLREEGVSEAELARTKTYLTGAYPLRFDGNARIADILVGMQLSGLDPDYVGERNALVEAVGVEDLARVAERLLRPEALSVVAVGEPEGLEGAEAAPAAEGEPGEAARAPLGEPALAD